MGGFEYHWLINYDLIGEDNWHNEIPKPITEWSFESNGPRTFSDKL